MNEGLFVDVEHEQGTFQLSASFTAPRGVTALFGPSGSGKTTLVNIIGGLVRPKRGRVVVSGTTLLDTGRIDVPTHRRRIGYVFQEGRLFPHLTVGQNLLFARLFSPSSEAKPELDAVIDLLGIASLLTRRPSGLSGGEKQRVALGRALLSRPRLLLMDEPLAALDEARKAEILPYVERLRDEAQVPIIYVSHSIGEIVRLANTLVILEEGRLMAAGPTSEVLGRLEGSRLARSSDAGAVLDCLVEGHDIAFGLTVLATRAGRLHVQRLNTPPGARLRVQVHARDVLISIQRPKGLSALNVFQGRVVDIGDSDLSDPTVAVQLDCSGAQILARLTRKSVANLRLERDSAVFAIVKSVSFDGDKLG
jgi:molybdate transport system ATP-binding protein